MAAAGEGVALGAPVELHALGGGGAVHVQVGRAVGVAQRRPVRGRRRALGQAEFARLPAFDVGRGPVFAGAGVARRHAPGPVQQGPQFVGLVRAVVNLFAVKGGLKFAGHRRAVDSELVAAAVVEDRVDAAGCVQEVGVVAGAAMQGILALASVQLVIAQTAFEIVVAGIAAQDVVATHAIDMIIFVAT